MWKSMGRCPPNLGVATKARIAERILCGTDDGGIDRIEKILTQARLLLVIPDGDVGDIDLG
jgi:hypothetical protein